MIVDQSGLTGESIPVDKHVGDTIYAGCIVKRGENECMVFAIGSASFYGKAVGLVAKSQSSGHLQAVLTSIALFCVIWILVFAIAVLLVQYIAYDWDYRRGIDTLLVILVGGIPIAMPTVLTVTMAIGATSLAKVNAVVTRITAVEELAGVDILCSDKTGMFVLRK